MTKLDSKFSSSFFARSFELTNRKLESALAVLLTVNGGAEKVVVPEDRIRASFIWGVLIESIVWAFKRTFKFVSMDINSFR